jgi:transposase
MKNFLTEDERSQLKAQHKKERDKRICDRIKAVLLRDKGWTWMQISDALLLSEEVLRIHLKEYQASKKLKPENGGSKEMLSIEQSQKLIMHLENYTYLYTKDIVAYVKASFGIDYSISGMTYWLKRNNFSYKKTALVPGKANYKLQEEWIKKYRDLKNKLSKDETICFMDGVHPTHNTQNSFGWIRKGVRKELLSNTGRKRLNLSGAVDLVNKKLHYQEDLVLNKDSTISFLKKIEIAYPTKKKIHLFVDNARYYKNKYVLDYLINSKIVMHFLPAYSPNLNPIERFWKWMKERVLYNTYYEHFDDFKQAVFGFLESISNLDPKSALGLAFSSRIRDHFRPLGSLIPNS